MVMQQPHTLEREPRSNRSYLRPVTHLTEMAAYTTFGSLLAAVRQNAHMTQVEVVDVLPAYFTNPQRVPPLNLKMYGDLERGRRYPAFDELFSLYRSLSEGCCIQFSHEERELYLLLARRKIEQKKHRVEQKTFADWQQLADELARLDQSSLMLQEQGFELRSAQAVVASDQKSAQVHFHIPPSVDTSHIVGRDSWVEHMFSFLHTKPVKKVVVIQALTGTGKTAGLKLLEKRLSELENYRVLSQTFALSENMTPGDYLDTFLASVLTELHVLEPEAKPLPLEERIQQVIAHISTAGRPGERLILLLDDVQVILGEKGELSPEWQQLLTAFIELEHAATMYLATREWPIWRGRERVYIAEIE